MHARLDEEGGKKDRFSPRQLCTSFSLLALSRRGLSRRDLDPSATATRPHRSPFGTIRLWYDIAVFVAVLSFHSARYLSDYVPRRPLEARVISARSRPRLHGLTHRSPCFAFGTIRLWYDITVFAAVLSLHTARYRSCDVQTACMLSYICEIPAIYTTSYTATI